MADPAEYAKWIVDNQDQQGSPEFETVAQAYQLSRSTFSGTPGGAVTGIKQPSRLSLLSPTGEAALAIGGAGALGAGAGAMLPELLIGAAGAARQIPQGARFAPWLESAAIAAKTAGRPTTALSGAVSGLGAETAGQVLEASGAPQWVAEGGRFVAGALTPETLPVAKWALEIFKKKLPTSVEETAVKLVARKISAKLEGRPQDIDAEEAALLNKLVGELRGGAVSENPARGVYDILQSGAKQKLAVGDQEARTLMGNANLAIQKELNLASKNTTYAATASERITKRGQDALATAQLQRLNIGEDAAQSDVGNALRQTIVTKHEVALTKRKAQFEFDKAEVEAIVKSKESKVPFGQFVNSMDEYRSLVRDLEGNLTPGKRSPDVQKTYDRILSGIRNPEKDVFGQNKPISFQALDDVRRQLGKVFEGIPPEGYEAISASDARKYYVLISNIQKKYAGAPQERLLEQYSRASAEMQIFGSKAGQKITALDKFDNERFKVDPSALPRQFFSTKQGVQDLLELTGERAVVVKAAKDFATGELDGLTSSQVREWMTKRREMLSVLPEVRDSVLKYANHLDYGENTARAAEGGVKRLRVYQDFQEKTAQQRSSAIEREAAARAAQGTTQRGQEAISLLGPKGEMFPVQNVKFLIESGTSKQWEQAAPLIMASPGGKEMLADSIRQTLSDRALTSIKGLSGFFDNNIRPAMTATRLMSPEQMERLSVQLRGIENMKLPEPQRIGLARRLIMQSVGGLAASGVARGGISTATSLADLVPNP